MKKYIAYRYYNAILYWTYERVELTEKELNKYIKNHLSELKNIEIFTRKDKVKIDINVNLVEKENK